MLSSPRRSRTFWSILAAGALVWISACSGEEQSSPDPICKTVTYENFAGPFLLNWCVGCHSSNLGEDERKDAPLNFNFDSLSGVREQAAGIRRAVVVAKIMPPIGGPSDADRELFGKWLDCGMPAKGEGFSPPDPPPTLDAGTTLPSGECANPRASLPDETLPRCAAATQNCVHECALEKPDTEVDACRNACLASDTTPAVSLSGFPVNCSSCTVLQLLSCSDQHGCHDETAAFVCCVEDCGGGDECASGVCAGELQAFGYCIYYSAPECIDYDAGPISACFAEGSAGSPGVGGNASVGGGGASASAGAGSGGKSGAAGQGGSGG